MTERAAQLAALVPAASHPGPCPMPSTWPSEALKEFDYPRS